MAKSKKNSSPRPSFDDDLLGVIRFSHALENMDEYTDLVRLAGSQVRFDLYTDQHGHLRACIRRARNIVSRYPAIERKMKRYLEKHLLDAYNDIWRPKGKRVLNGDQFFSWLTLEGVSTHPEPSATFWFDAGDLLLGHGLQLRMVERNKFVDHDMVG